MNLIEMGSIHGTAFFARVRLRGVTLKPCGKPRLKRAKRSVQKHEKIATRSRARALRSEVEV